ncbi:FHA domain-containing protein [Arthrobacter sp. RAF14]|uniref:FHA domain-containing protein n=1 Tax=Arthrobacter sp. RAF14 TaxID=3233051 RepID=UPI003F8EAA65
MNANHYRQGSWLYVLRNGIAVVVSPDAGTERIQQLWELLGRNPSVDQLLNEVTRSFGTSVTGLPDFAVVDHRDSLRVFLRGDLQVRTLDGSDQEVHGRGVTTWNERTLASSESFEIRAGQPDEEDEDPWMPLDAGVVTASVLVVGDLPAEITDELELSAPAPEDTVEAPLFAAPSASWNAPEAAAPSVPLGGAAWDPSQEADDEEDDDDESASFSLDGQTDSLATELLGARAPREDSQGDAAADASEAGGPEGASGESDASGEDDDSGASRSGQDGAAQDNGAGEDAAQDGAAQDDDAQDEDADGASAALTPSSGDAGQHSGDVPAHHHDSEAPNDLTTTYDHLWDQAVEPAAEEPVEETPRDAPATSPATTSAAAPAATPESTSGTSGDDAPESARHDESQNTLLPSAESDDSLIDEVPWARAGGPAPVAQPLAGSARIPAPAQAPGASGSAPPLPPAPPSFPPAGPQGDDLDHDGHTVFRSELPGAAGPGAPQAAPAVPPANGPRVLARMCPRGHANPPTRTHCMSCEEAISGDAASVPRPALGRLRLPSGETVLLDRNVILGRQPSVSRVSGGDMPHLVQLDSPKRDISRSHAEVRLEGWNVVLCDLNSSNGTVLLREGQSPRRLGQSETALVLSGDVAELGDQVYVVFEDLP